MKDASAAWKEKTMRKSKKELPASLVETTDLVEMTEQAQTIESTQSDQVANELVADEPVKNGLAATKTASTKKDKAVAKAPVVQKPALPLCRSCKPEEIVVQARDCGEACIMALLDEVENGKGATRIAAARELLERGYGKPKQPLEVSGALDVKLEAPEEVSAFLAGLK